MLVGQLVSHALHLRDLLEDLLGHFVHGVLNTGALILGEPPHSGLPSVGPAVVELALGIQRLDGLNISQALPGPGGSHIGGEDAIPGLWECGVLIPDEAVESRASGLEDGQPADGAGDGDAVLAGDDGLDIPGLVAVADKAVRMGLAVDVESRPPVNLDADVGDVDVGVLFQEVGSEDRGVELGGIHGVLLSCDVDCVFDGVGGHDDRVVGLGVRGFNVTLEEAADGHFCDGVSLGDGVAVGFEDSDIVLAVASSRDGHLVLGVVGNGTRDSFL